MKIQRNRATLWGVAFSWAELISVILFNHPHSWILATAVWSERRRHYVSSTHRTVEVVRNPQKRPFLRTDCGPVCTRRSDLPVCRHWVACNLKRNLTLKDCVSDCRPPIDDAADRHFGPVCGHLWTHRPTTPERVEPSTVYERPVAQTGSTSDTESESI